VSRERRLRYRTARHSHVIGTRWLASEMHRWGRMTGAFSIIVMVTWVVLGTATTTGFLAARSSLLWPGIALAILAVIGLFGGFGFDYLAGHKP